MKGKKVLSYLGVVAIVATMFKMFYGFHPLLQGWFPACLWTAAYFYYHPRDLSQRSVVCFFLFFLTAFFFFLLGSTCGRMDAATDFVYFISFFLFPYVYFYFLVNYTSNRYRSFVVTLLTIIILYYSYRTIVITQGDSIFIRRVINMDENMNLVNLYRLRGLADYSLTHAMTFMMPACVFFFRATSKPLIKLIWLGGGVVCLLLVYLGGASTAIMMSLAALVISFIIGSRRTIKANIIIISISIGIMLFLINKDFLLAIISIIRELLPSGNAYSKKLNDFENSLVFETAEGDVGGRLSLYGRSWNTFIENPLGNIDGAMVGGHAYFLDLLASVGIFAIFLFAFIIFVFFYTYRFIPIRAKSYYILGFGLFVLMGSVKNFGGYDYFIISFIYLPLTLMLYRSFTLRKNSNK